MNNSIQNMKVDNLIPSSFQDIISNKDEDLRVSLFGLEPLTKSKPAFNVDRLLNDFLVLFNIILSSLYFIFT